MEKRTVKTGASYKLQTKSRLFVGIFIVFYHFNPSFSLRYCPV